MKRQVPVVICEVEAWHLCEFAGKWSMLGRGCVGDNLKMACDGLEMEVMRPVQPVCSESFSPVQARAPTRVNAITSFHDLRR